MIPRTTLLSLGIALGLLTLGCEPSEPAAQSTQSRSAALQANGPLAGHNVLLITLDTTRADRLGCYGYEDAATPALDAIASSGVLFEQAFAQVPLTLPSHTSILTGKYPREHGIRNNNQGGLSEELDSLAKAFGRYDYETGAFIAAFVLDAQYGLDRGFDVYADDMVTSKMGVQPAEWQNPADVVTDRALEWLESVKGKPFFAWVHYYDPHEPYAPPEPFRTQFDDPYDGEIAFMDTQVKRLTDWLDAGDLDERTLVVVIGDHGESFREEHGEQGHSIFCYNTNLHVPFLVKHPRLDATGTRVPAIVETVDIYPTIMDLFGFDMSEGLLSRSLVAALDGDGIEDVPSYAESHFGKDSFNWAEQRSLTTARWKYVSSTVPELFDRAEDPNEHRNIHDLAPDVAAAMLEALKARYAAMEEGEPEAVPDSPEQMAALEALGYVGAKNPLTEPSKEFLTPGLDDPKEKLIIVDRLKAGMQALKQGDHDVAVTLLKSVKEECPYSAAAYTSLGIAYLQTGKAGLAEQVLDELLHKDPTNYAANVAMGDVQLELQRPKRAVNHYKAALGTDLEYADVYAKLGVAYRELGQIDEALRNLRRAVEEMPEFPQAHLELANTLSQQGDVRGAVRHYETVIEQEPKFAVAHYNLGLELVKLGRIEEAAKRFRGALRVQPKYADAMINLAIALTNLKRLDEAREVLADARDVDAIACKALYLLGVVNAHAGRVDKTIELYEQALTCEPFDPSPVTELAAYYWQQQNQPAEALRVLRAGLEKAPQNVGILVALAELLATSRDDSVRDGSGAVLVAERAAKQTDRKDPRALRVLAAALAEAGNFDSALNVSRQARAMAEARGMRQVAQQLTKDVTRYENKQPVRAGR